MNSKKTSALVIDSYPIVLHAIEQMLVDRLGFESVFIANDGSKASSILKQNQIDIIILDIKQLDFDGLDFLRRIRAKQYSGKVLFISSNNHGIYSDTAKKLGANGYVLKSDTTKTIENAVSSVISGYDMFKNNTDLKFLALSKRETIVYNYLAKGLTNKHISELLSISTKTVSTYKSRILNKCKVNSIVELIKIETNT